MMLSQEDLPEVFADVTPIPQDDGPNPVCAIDYSPQFIQAYDYMRAMLKAGEKSGMFLFKLFIKYSKDFCFLTDKTCYLFTFCSAVVISKIPKNELYV